MAVAGSSLPIKTGSKCIKYQYFKDANMAGSKCNCCNIVHEMKINDYKNYYLCMCIQNQHLYEKSKPHNLNEFEGLNCFALGAS